MLRGVHCTAPSRPLDTSCHARDVASARDLLSLHGAQREENKFEMEVSCHSTKLRRVLIRMPMISSSSVSHILTFCWEQKS